MWWLIVNHSPCFSKNHQKSFQSVHVKLSTDDPFQVGELRDGVDFIPTVLHHDSPIISPTLVQHLLLLLLAGVPEEVVARLGQIIIDEDFGVFGLQFAFVGHDHSPFPVSSQLHEYRTGLVLSSFSQFNSMCPVNVILSNRG